MYGRQFIPFKPDDILQFNTCNGKLEKYVELGFGVAILDEFAITPDDRKRLLIFNLDKFFERRKYQLIVRKKKYLSPAVRLFIRLLHPIFSLK